MGIRIILQYTNQWHKKKYWPHILSLQLRFKRWFAVITVHVTTDSSERGVDATSMFEIHHPGSNQIENLTDVEHHTHDGRHHHDVGENGLLGGPGYVAVHQIRAGLDITLDLPGQLEAVIDVVEQVEKSDLKGGLDEEAHQVSPPQAAMLLSRVVVQSRVLAVLGSVLALTFFPVGHMQHHHEGRASDEDQLESPEANVGDGEVVIVADVGATGLAGVAVEVCLVIAPDALGGHHEDQHPEDEDHCQPDTSEGGGVLVDSIEKTLQKLPVHGFSFDWLLVTLEVQKSVFKRCRGKLGSLTQQQREKDLAMQLK